MQFVTTAAAVSSSRITRSLLFGALLAAATIGTASADPADAVATLSVRYNPANLATDSGTRTVYRQLVRAAEVVCPAYSGSRLISSEVEECRTQAVARAVAKINDPRLAALSMGRTKTG